MKRSAWVYVAIIAAVISGNLALAQELRFFRIGTGSTAGANFPLGGLIASVISNPPGSRDCGRGGSCGVPGLIAVAQATQGSAENAREVGGGRLDAAIIQADVASLAYEGRGEFTGKNQQGDLRAATSLYPEAMQIVVRRDSGITTIAALKGKRVSLDTPSSGSQLAARAVLAAAGVRLADLKVVHVDIGTATEMMRERKLDAFFYVGGSPAPAITQLSEAVELHLIGLAPALIERVRKANPHYQPIVVPPSVYKRGEETTTLGIYALLVVNQSLPNDFVYAILRSLWHPSARTMLSSGHVQGRMINLETALSGLTIPLHPGAQRYYNEAGLLREGALTPTPTPSATPPTSAAPSATPTGDQSQPATRARPQSSR